MCLYVLSSVLWCPLRFPHKHYVGLSLPPVVCRRAMSYVRYMCLFVYSGVQPVLCCVFRRLVYPMLPVSLCFSSSFCTLCCQFLCIFRRLVYPMLPVSLCFSSSCVPYVASFSVFFVVLCTLCCQFLCVFRCLVASFSGLSIFIGPSVFTDVYLTIFIVFNIYSRNTYPVITEMVYLIPFRNACTKSGSLRFSQFSGCWLIMSVYIFMSFDFPFVRLFGVR
jgi:hypothetical protein